jgi:hypothetical protein
MKIWEPKPRGTLWATPGLLPGNILWKMEVQIKGVRGWCLRFEELELEGVF